MSLFRALNTASLEANLNKNEAKVYTALMNQTLGYGKSFDHLTDKRLAQLTGIRIDRLYIAIEGVIEKELFEVEESKHYDYRYSIAEKFLDQYPVFFTPHLPKNGENFREKENISEIQKMLPKNGDIHNTTSTSFDLTSSNQQQQQRPVQAIAKPAPSCNFDVVVVELPKIIEEKHRPACIHALGGLSVEQQQRVLKVFEIKAKSEVIYNPVGLLIVLAKAEREGRLIVPKVIKHPSHQLFHAPEAAKPSEISEPSEPCEASNYSPNSADKEIMEDHFGKLNWLRFNAKLNDQSMLALAEKLQMKAYLQNQEMLQFWLTFHAKQEHKTVQELAKILELPL